MIGLGSDKNSKEIHWVFVVPGTLKSRSVWIYEGFFIHRRRHKENGFMYTTSTIFLPNFWRPSLHSSKRGLSHLWNCFCSGYSWSRDGIRRMGKLVHKSRPQQLCLIPTSVLLGKMSKAKLGCAAYKRAIISSVMDTSAPCFYLCSPNCKFLHLLSFMAV